MSGHASFVAPRTDAQRFLTVVLTAQRGKATTESRTGINLTPPVAINPVPGDVGAPGAAPSDGIGAAPGQPSALVLSAPATVSSGEPIHVEVSGAASGLQLALLDGSGNELARRDLPAGKSSSVFRAPAVRVRTQLLFEATSARGAGADTTVRPITVLP
jgi:hypothetical protein